MTHKVVTEMEHMVPELNYYKEKKLFKEEEIQAIIRKRRNFEEALATKPLLAVFLLYIEHEVILERIYNKRAKDLVNKKNYIRARIDSLYKRAEFSCLGIEDIHTSHLEYFISINDRAKVKEVALELPKKFAGSRSAWIAAANALRIIGETEGSRILLQRSLRVLSNKDKKEVLEAYIKLEEDNPEDGSDRIIEILKKQVSMEV